MIQSAQKGDPHLQSGLALLYMQGIAVDRNPLEGIKWMRKAAEQGHGQAQYALALNYGNGDGVKQNTVEAMKWLVKAADQEHEDAACLLRKAAQKASRD